MFNQRGFDHFNQINDMARGYARRTTFSRQFAAYSVMMMQGPERPEVNGGGKIIMPPSALESLSRLNISYPMLFKIENRAKDRTSHTGVLEFIADEGKVYLPGWMMRNLLLAEGDPIALTSCTLPVASYSKFKPQQVDFLQISNPKAVLEKHLRSFACLSKGDMVSVEYLGRDFELQIVETKPADAVNIIECDLNVEFEAPVGYQEPAPVKPQEEPASSFGTPDIQNKLIEYYEKKTNFSAFHGKGGRIDGKKKGTKGVKQSIDLEKVYVRGVPNYDWDGQTLNYIRKGPLKKNDELPSTSFEAFSGTGQCLRKKKSKPRNA